MSSREAAEKKLFLKKQANSLIEKGQKLKDDEKEAKVVDGWWARNKEKRKVKGDFNQFKLAVQQLNKETEIFFLELELYNKNPVVFFLKFILGILFIVVSLMWWLHM